MRNFKFSECLNNMAGVTYAYVSVWIFTGADMIPASAIVRAISLQCCL